MNRFSSFIVLLMTALLLVIGCSGDTPPPSATGNTTSTENMLIAGSMYYASDSGSGYAGVTSASGSSTSTASVIATSRSVGTEVNIYDIMNDIAAEPGYIELLSTNIVADANGVYTLTYDTQSYGTLVRKTWDIVNDGTYEYPKNTLITLTSSTFTIEFSISNMVITSTDAEMILNADVSYSDSRISNTISYKLTQILSPLTGDYTVSIISLKLGDGEVVVTDDLKSVISTIVGADVTIGGQTVTTSTSNRLSAADETAIINNLSKVENTTGTLSIRNASTTSELRISGLAVDSNTLVYSDDLELAQVSYLNGAALAEQSSAEYYRLEGEFYINGTEYEAEDFIFKVDGNTITRYSGLIEADDRVIAEAEYSAIYTSLSSILNALATGDTSVKVTDTDTEYDFAASTIDGVSFYGSASFSGITNRYGYYEGSIDFVFDRNQIEAEFLFTDNGGIQVEIIKEFEYNDREVKNSNVSDEIITALTSCIKTLVDQELLPSFCPLISCRGHIHF